MKRTAAISIIAVALALTSVAAESTPTPSSSPAPQVAPTGGKVAAAMSRAAQGNQYLFVFFYEKDDDTTSVARKTFDETVKTVAPEALSVAVERTAPSEKEIVT